MLKVRKGIFKTKGNENLHEICNISDCHYIKKFVRITNFPHNDTHKHIWTSHRMTKTDHILTDKRRHSCMTVVQSYKGADYDIHYSVTAKTNRK
jgi:hypothetical protein